MARLNAWRFVSASSGEYPYHLARTRYGLAILCILVSFFIRCLLTPILGHQATFIVFVPATMIAGWYGGLGPGIFALIAGLLLGEFLRLPLFPGRHLLMGPDAMIVLVYLFTAGIGLAVVRSLHRARYRAHTFGTWAGTLERQVEERTQAERALQQQKATLDFTLGAAHLCIWELDIHKAHFDLSCKYEKILGPGRDHFQGHVKELVRLIHPLDRRRVARTVTASIRDGRDREAEFRITWTDGSLHWILAKWKVDGKIDDHELAHRILGVMMEITARKQSEQALQESEERARALFKSFPIPTYTFQREANGEFVLVDFNEAAFQFSRRRIVELLGRTALDIFAPRPDVIEKITQSYEQKTSVKYETGYRFITTGECKELSMTYVFVPPDLVMIHTEDITERKHAEQALRESKEMARAQFESFPIPTYTWKREANGEFVLVDFNVAGRLISGDRIPGFLGKTAQEMLGERPDIIEDVAHCYEQKKCLHREMSYRFRTGEMKELAVTYVFISPDLVMVHTDDITERKHAEQALQRTLALLSTTLESTEDGILVVDLNGKVVSCNRRFGELWEIPADMLASKEDATLLQYARPLLAQPEGFLRRVRELMAQTEAESRDEIVFKNGRVLERFSRPHRVDGHTVGRVWSFHDVTARKRTEEASRQSELRMREMADAMPQIVWTTRPDGQPEYFNRRWFEYTGQEVSEAMTPAGLQVILHPDDLPLAAAHWARSLATGETFQIEARYRNAERNFRWFLIRAVPIKDEQGRITRWFGSSTDIEDQKHTEQDLKVAREELLHYTRDLEGRVAERTAKLEETVKSLEGVLYHVAHDLRAPLRSLSGFTQLLVESLGSNIKDEDRDSAARIISAAQRMDQLILDLLAYGRLGHSTLSLKELDLGLLVQGVLDYMKGEIQSAHAEIEIVSPLPRVLADSNLLAEVLVQLLSNSLTFVSPGIFPRVRIGAEQQQGKTRLWIEDNGIGIDKAYWGRIFRVFERLHAAEEYNGTGIGLAIVAKAMERMGGCAGVESEPGKGSRFWVEFA